MQGNDGKGLWTSWRRSLAWALIGLAFTFFGLGLALQTQVPAVKLGVRPSTWPIDPINLGMLAYAAVGGLVALRRPRNRVGWLFLVIGFTWEIFGLTEAYIIYTKIITPNVPLIPPAVLWLPRMIWVISYGITPMLLFLFPDGRLPSRRWRIAVWVLGVGLICGLAASGTDVEAGANDYSLPSLLQMLGLGQLVDPVQTAMGMAYLLVLLAGAAAIVLRYLHAQGDERLQLKWFAYAGVLAVAINLVEDFFYDQLVTLDPLAKNPASLFWGIPAGISFVIVAGAAAVAILRYRLYEIDILIRRTLIYAALSIILALIYAGTIILLEGVLGPLTGQTHSDAAIVLSTLAIATLFTPLRRRVQGWIDRRFFRKRYNADQVLARFYSTARNEVDLEQISDRFLGVVNETMQPDRLSLWIRPEGFHPGEKQSEGYPLKRSSR